MGYKGKIFKIIKFRTMEETPQSYAGPKITAHDDPRITPTGRWLRDTKLNEFPQFWNVLMGDMSLVGPRPEDPEIAAKWPARLRDEILSVRPGITSPASVNYRDEESLLSSSNLEQKYLAELGPDKMRLDQLYVRYRSSLLDLDILFWTLLVLIPKVGSYNPPEDLLFVGFLTRLVNRFLNWFTIDLLVTFLVFGITGIIYRMQAPLNVGWFHAILMVFGFAFLFSAIEVAFGTNRICWSKANSRDFLNLLPPWILATIIAFFANLLIGYLPNNLILIAYTTSLLGFITIRYHHPIISVFTKWVLKVQEKNWSIRERVLIIGLGASAQHTAWLFEHLLNSKAFCIVGFVDNDLMIQGMRYYGSNVLGKWKDIPALVKKWDIGVVILADYRVDAQDFRSIKEICMATSAKFVVMPDMLATVNRLTKPLVKSREDRNSDREKLGFACLDCLAGYSASNRKHYWKNWEKNMRVYNQLDIAPQIYVKYKDHRRPEVEG